MRYIKLGPGVSCSNVYISGGSIAVRYYCLRASEEIVVKRIPPLMGVKACL